MTCNIVHRTVYGYGAPVTVSQHAARLEPRSLRNQFLEEYSLRIEPEPSVRKTRTDYFGNRICFFSIQEVHLRLEIVADCRVTVVPVTQPALSLSPRWEEVAEIFSDPVSPEVVEPYEFMFDSPLLRASPALADYARQSFSAESPLLMAVLDFNRRVHRDFKYDKIATTVATPLEEVIKNRRGVCQDFAHFAIACLRSLGLAARYVSGYLRTQPPAGKPALVGAEASHAWFSVYCPGMGWIDFDPTNNVMPETAHITLAYGRDFNDVSPVSGIITGGGKHDVKAGVTVSVL
ncbi:MAG TPA: transglutaminase family protein [Candidatus Baltobacteraceae bacterium]|jgi:transglutaminase-like putative cysteine protease|nr:transglutaminase family protein [Candidatus Baltobacteraceae bacterium]